MANSLGQVSIDVLANIANMVSDLGRAQQENAKAARAMQKQWDDFGRGVKDTLGNIAGALGLAFSVDKFVEMGRASIELGDQLNKMSQKIGVSVENLSALRAQAQLSDVGLEDFGASMAKLARTATEAAAGSKQQAAAFQSMGVSVTDVTGRMRPMQQILQDVAGKFAGYADSASKTALAQQLFGKSGAQLIPLLNELGEKGFAEVVKQAEAYNQVIGGEQAKQSEEFKDNLTKLEQAASGFANAVMKELLPSLVSLTGDMDEAAKTNDRYSSSASGVVTIIKAMILAFGAIKEALSTAVTILIGFYDAVASSFSAAGQIVAAWATATKERIKAAFTLDGDAFSKAGDQYAAQLAKIGTSVAARFKSISSNITSASASSIDGVVKQYQKLFGAFSNVASGFDTTAKKARDGKAPIVDAGNAADKTAQQALALAQAWDKVNNDLDTLAGKLGGPAAQAQADYSKGLRQLETDMEALAIAGGNVADIIPLWQHGEEMLAQILQQTSDKIKAQQDIVGNLAQEYANDERLVGLSGDAHKTMEEIIKAETEARSLYEQHLRDTPALTEQEVASIKRLSEAHLEYEHTVENSKKVQEDWVNIWKTGFDQLADDIGKFFTGQIDSWSSFGDELVNIAKQIVASIISQFVKLSIINPIMNSIFGSAAGGTGGGLLPTMNSIAGGMFSGGGANTASSGGYTQSSTGDFSFISMGRQLWQGFQGGYSSFFSGADAYTMGPPTVGGSTSSYYGGGYTSGFGQALGIAGGVYAGYNRYQQSGGGIGGVAGGLAYGYGTYAAGAGLATVAATGSLSAGLAAIPVVGWIAIAAMLVDMISGGKLFGTKGKFNFGEQAINIGPQGATVTAGYDLKGQKPLFGGSTHSWQTLTPDQASIDAANQFFESLKSQTEDFAKQFGVTMGDVVGGQFIATFDKKGNVTKTESTVLGKTYSEDQQAFQTRLAAENMIAVLNQIDKGLSDAVEQYRQSADQLMAVTQALAGAEAYIQQGGSFLALGTDQSLTALLKLAQGAQQFGESIDQTIQRLEQAQAQYDQFVGQFKPQPTFASNFQQVLAGIDTQLQQNIAQANAYARAAGAEGAATQDLANIHAYAAQQFAAAVAQLKAASNSLAASLGYALPNNIDDINNEIAALEGKANSGGRAIGGFGNAMTTAAQRATDAMNLLLGDLSPLNDQQKLQQALAGLRAGTVSQQQVLEIGRRLYATGSDYAALFAQVQAIGDHTGGRPGGGASGGGGGGGLSAADQQRLHDLQERRTQLQEAQRHADSLQLAQNVADIVSATGETIDQALADLGIDNKGLQQFIQDLGLKDKAGFDAFIESLEKQTDSAGDNTRDIAGRLDTTNELLTEIRDGLNPGGHSTHGTPNADDAIARDPTGHGGHARPGAAGATSQDVQENTQQIRDLNRNLRDRSGAGSRTTRGNNPALPARVR